MTAARLQQADLEDNLAGAPAVEPKSRVVNVSTPDGITRTYKAEDEIPLSLFGSARLPVAAIFE